ncbi:MAG: hypothetical protein LN561_05575 [Rickettsia endosymbiont of Labidopullus appendiculatus]|nr:hypothetical protein [Rickettsia endosymbiont of Labidopullus appendiculatus]
MIAYFLEKNRSVTHIDLRWNEIGNEGAKSILEVQAIRKNSTITEINLKWNKPTYNNKIDYTLLNNISTTLEKNIQAKKTLSKKSDQGIDSAQKKLPANDIGLKEKQEVSKGMQQLKKAGQEKKSEQQEGINATLAKIINKQAMQDDILKLIIQKLDVVIGEVKLLTEQSSMQVWQTQLTENSLGTGEHPELLLGVVADQYYSPE